MTQFLHPLQSWIPYKIDIKDDQIFCKWLNTFNKPFVEPFFDETIGRCRALDPHVGDFLSVSDLMVLEDWAEGLNTIKPTAFIFHISRCGSTLVSQLLGVNAHNISLAEVPFFDDILRLHFNKAEFDKAKTGRLFTDAIKFYGQKRNGKETDLFIKADSWHVFFYEQIRELYPDVPFIFLYRKPDEVLSSHQKRRGMQAVPGLIEPELFGFNREETLQMNQDVYTAKIIESYFSKYLEIIGEDKLSLFLNYNIGILPIIEKVASFINLEIRDDEFSVMALRSQYHSKYPDATFSEKPVSIADEYLDTAFGLYRKLVEIAG